MWVSDADSLKRLDDEHATYFSQFKYVYAVVRVQTQKGCQEASQEETPAGGDRRASEEC